MERSQDPYNLYIKYGQCLWYMVSLLFFCSLLQKKVQSPGYILTCYFPPSPCSLRIYSHSPWGGQLFKGTGWLWPLADPTVWKWCAIFSMGNGKGCNRDKSGSFYLFLMDPWIFLWVLKVIISVGHRFALLGIVSHWNFSIIHGFTRNKKATSLVSVTPFIISHWRNSTFLHLPLVRALQWLLNKWIANSTSYFLSCMNYFKKFLALPGKNRSFQGGIHTDSDFRS